VYTIIDIESDNYDALPVMTYVRGYIVSYCRILGIDPSEVLSQLEENSPGKKSLERKINSTTKSSPFFTKKKLLIALLLAVAAISVKYLLPVIKSMSSPVETTSGVDIVNSEAEVGSTEQNTQDLSIEGESNQAKTEEITSDLKEKLELTFDAISWVDIQTEDKQKIVYKSFTKGETHSLKAKLPLNIFLDNSKGVTLSYEGKLVDLQQYTKNGYAKFTLEK